MQLTSPLPRPQQKLEVPQIWPPARPRYELCSNGKLFPTRAPCDTFCDDVVHFEFKHRFVLPVLPLPEALQQHVWPGRGVL